MRTTIDIPDELYRQLKIEAAARGETVRALFLERLTASPLKTGARPAPADAPRFPLIRSKKPGSLKLGEEGVYEYIPFP